MDNVRELIIINGSHYTTHDHPETSRRKNRRNGRDKMLQSLRWANNNFHSNVMLRGDVKKGLNIHQSTDRDPLKGLNNLIRWLTIMLQSWAGRRPLSSSIRRRALLLWTTYLIKLQTNLIEWDPSRPVHWTMNWLGLLDHTLYCYLIDALREMIIWFWPKEIRQSSFSDRPH